MVVSAAVMRKVEAILTVRSPPLLVGHWSLPGNEYLGAE